MEIFTHQQISRKLCGTPVDMAEGFCQVRFKPSPEMVADQRGLVHGGFIFGAADYAAMLAVNHPNVVLAGAAVKFLKPVKAGETVDAEARVVQADGRKRTVSVLVRRESEKVFEGDFSCLVSDRHVLSPEE